MERICLKDNLFSFFWQPIYNNSIYLIYRVSLHPQFRLLDRHVKLFFSAAQLIGRQFRQRRRNCRKESCTGFHIRDTRSLVCWFCTLSNLNNFRALATKFCLRIPRSRRKVIVEVAYCTKNVSAVYEPIWIQQSVLCIMDSESLELTIGLTLLHEYFIIAFLPIML